MAYPRTGNPGVWGTAGKPPPVPPKAKKPTFITGKNGNRIQVNPNGTRYVIKRAGGGTTGQSSGGIETMDQIEARVRKLADEQFTRDKNEYTAQADQMRNDAQARQRAMAGAYAAAAAQNQTFGADIQKGWDSAAGTLQGLAGAGSGSIADALRADVATQDEALARVGATGTGFDATSQGGVEQYRGGTVPAEYMARMGGIGREFINRSAINTTDMGLNLGQASYDKSAGEINRDLQDSLRKLTAGRGDYETKLREQLVGAQNDQIKLAQDQAEYVSKLRLDTLKVEQAQQKIDQTYEINLAKVTNANDRLRLDKWKKDQDIILSQARNDIARAAETRLGQSAAFDQKNGGSGGMSGASKSAAYGRASKVGDLAVEKWQAGVKAKALSLAKIKDQKNPTPEESARYVALSHQFARERWGAVMANVINAITPHLKQVGLSPLEIKQQAFNIVTKNNVSPPPGYKVKK
jgi:hypothetical protein